ncbi:hypothetical protein [Achromobacter insuavis]|nr:hypothetical protein [Achromobacter insuavis]
MKKGDAAVAAERLLEGKGWVPELMRCQPALPAVLPIIGCEAGE